jgi:hypothetical protein
MPTNWETADVLKSPMEIAWQFDYAIDIDKLKNLYSKSKQRQWDAERDLDWSLEIDPSKPIVDERQFAFDRIPCIQQLPKAKREEFTAHATAHLLSQFLHGEQGALMTAAATQTMDEARHVEAYERYIHKLAIVYPLSPWLKQLIDATLQADHWVKIAIGMNMVVEGLALGAFHNMRRATTCELLRGITNLVLQDESRHVAFGNVYVGETIRDMHSDDREDVAEFAFQAIKTMSDSMGGPDGKGPRQHDPGFVKVLDQVGIDVQVFVKDMVEMGAAGIRAEQPPGQIHSFKDLMMPALVRVGAVTERSRKLYEEAGIPIWDDASRLESMEDHDTGDIRFAEA